jgi:hypothetical protein
MSFRGVDSLGIAWSGFRHQKAHPALASQLVCIRNAEQRRSLMCPVLQLQQRVVDSLQYLAGSRLSLPAESHSVAL